MADNSQNSPNMRPPEYSPRTPGRRPNYTPPRPPPNTPPITLSPVRTENSQSSTAIKFKMTPPNSKPESEKIILSKPCIYECESCMKLGEYKPKEELIKNFKELGFEIVENTVNKYEKVIKLDFLITTALKKIISGSSMNKLSFAEILNSVGGFYSRYFMIFATPFKKHKLPLRCVLQLLFNLFLGIEVRQHCF